MTARLTPAERLLRSMTESAWLQIVQGIAGVSGWRFYHAPDNRPIVSGGGHRYVQATRAGFPDLILVRRERLLAVELKTETGRVAAEQVAWLTALAAAGVEVGVWRPRDRDLMQRVLVHGDPMPTFDGTL